MDSQTSPLDPEGCGFTERCSEGLIAWRQNEVRSRARGATCLGMMFLDRWQRLARPLAGGVFLRFVRLTDGDFLDDGWADWFHPLDSYALFVVVTYSSDLIQFIFSLRRWCGR